MTDQPGDFSTTAIAGIAEMVNNANETMEGSFLCGPGTDCYKEKKIERLLQAKTASEDIRLHADEMVSRAEKKWYIYKSDNDESEYNNFIFDRFSTAASGDFRKNSIEKQRHYMRDLSQLLKQYQTEYDLIDNAKKLLTERQKQNERLVMKLNKYEGTVQTSERKVVYEYRNMETLHLFRRVMLFLYYSIIVMYLAFGRFIPEKQYTQTSVWLIILIALCIPLMLNMLVKWLFIIKDYIGYWFEEMPHKDVYIDL
jgi:hypothetical protein